MIGPELKTCLFVCLIMVDESKTKVLHFRQKAMKITDYSFKCGNKTIDVDSSYKYLGFWMNEFLFTKFSNREIAKSASRALGAIYSKVLCTGGMNISVYTKLVTRDRCCSFVQVYGVTGMSLS